MKRPLRRGDRYPCWWNSDGDGKALVLAVRPYTGRFKQFFSVVLTLDCHQTRSRQTEMAA